MTAPIAGSLLTEIISISADAIICVDREQRVTFFNEGAERIFGYEAREVLGQPLEILLPERHRDAHRRHLRHFAESGVDARRMGERQEIAGIRKNGEEFPAEAAIAKLQTGSDIVYSVVLRDVTEARRQQTRQQFLVETGEALATTLDLAETLEQLAQLWIPTLADATAVEIAHGTERWLVFAAAREGRSVFVSDTLVLPGATLAAIAGVAAAPGPATVVPTENALAALPDAARLTLAMLAPRLAVTVPISRRGELLGRALLFRAGAAGMVPDDLLLAEDLARRGALALGSATLHDAVQRAVRARDETVSVVSHDLRNPLAAVKMLSGALLKSAPETALSPEVADQLGLILQAARQMDTLIQDLLDVTLAEAGRFSVDLQSAACAPLLLEPLKTLAPIADGKQVVVTTELDPALPAVLADAERVAQVLSNVVGNAIKFTPAGGRVTVRAVPRGREVVVSVQDDGPGIPAEHLERVFDRFWQSTRRFRGAGLGLPIAKAIIEAHGGRIWAESDLGRGATFYFTLSASQE